MSVTPRIILLTPEGNAKKTIGGSISKKLLTPCRRLGLSKKSKTPLSEALNICSITSSASQEGQSYAEDIVCKDVPQTDISKKLHCAKDTLESWNKHSNINSNNKKCKYGQVFTPQKSKSKRQLINELSNKSTLKENFEQSRNKTVHNSCSKNANEIVNDATSNSDATNNKQNSCTVTDVKIKEKEGCNSSRNNVQKMKSIRRCLSMKKSSEIESPNKNTNENIMPSITSSNTVSNLPECTKLLIENLMPHAKPFTSIDGPNSFARKLLGKDDIETEITLIRDRIINKEQQLRRLKQANVYQKLHKINEIEQLTLRWKRGCIQVLPDLLLQLQRHKHMDMSTLIENLKIPKSIISCTADGNLV